MMNQQVIQKRFCRSLSTYSQEAQIQKKVAGELAYHLKTLMGSDFPRVLEIGCGTGLFTHRLAKELQIQELVINDLVPDVGPMVSAGLPQQIQCSFLPGDAEALSFSGNQDLICSSSVVQWFGDLSAFFEKVNQSLSISGVWAFSTFGPSNFKELKELGLPGLSYKPQEWFRNELEKNFKIIRCGEWKERCYFSQGADVLRHLKRTGVTGTNTKVWTKNDLKNFETAYREGYGDSLPLTYHPMWFICKKI